MTRDEWKLGETRYFRFNTHKADGTPITLAGTPLISAYLANNLTEITTGITLSVDSDSKTGTHLVTVDTSSGYAANGDVDFFISAGTVDGVSQIGVVVKSVRIVPEDTAAQLTFEVPYGVATLLRIPLRNIVGTPSFAAGDALITQDDGTGTDNADNAPTYESGCALWTISAAESTAPSANGAYRVMQLHDQTNPPVWGDVDIVIVTTDHQSATKPNGVIRQVVPDATPGATSFAVTDAALPTTALGGKFTKGVALIVASDVADDINCAAYVTGYSKSSNTGTFTYAGGWNRTPTGTAASIKINIYAAGIGSAEALGTQARADVNTEADTAVADGLALFLGTLTGAVATDAGNSATTFKVNTDVSTDVRKGTLRLTSGALAGESCLVSWTGTQVTVLSQLLMPTALKQFSATPADAVTFTFTPL